MGKSCTLGCRELEKIQEFYDVLSKLDIFIAQIYTGWGFQDKYIIYSSSFIAKKLSGVVQKWEIIEFF